MVSYIAIFLCLINITLLIIVLVKFKKLFSTDAIIERTRFQMNKMISNINSEANRDIELMNESTKRIKALIAESDKKMESFREATEILRNMIAEAKKTGKNSFIYETKHVVDIKTPAQRKKERVSNAYSSGVDPDAAYMITKNNQKSLFDEDEQVPESIMKDETIVTPDGTAYKEVPLIITKVYDEDERKSSENKTLSEKVRDLFDQGMQVEEIATELSCSVTEVQLIIDLG